MNQLRKFAASYLERGYSVIACDDSKKSIVSWKKYTMDLPTPTELDIMFGKVGVSGIAIICGQVSGNLEVVDVDCKYDLTGKLWDNIISEIKRQDKDLYKNLVIVKTQSNGYHIYYKCETIQGNQKLANRQTNDSERKDNPLNKIKVLIETRGEGGYVLTAPSNGYEIIQNDIASVPVISVDQRDLILSICRSFDEVTEESTYSKQSTIKSEKSPFADYNERGDVIELLSAYGWTVVKSNAERVLFKRPGDTKAKTSGDYHRGLNFFKVFTTSSEFEPGKGYRPAAVFCKLECQDNWSIAAQKLSAMGYGDKVIVPKKFREIYLKSINDGKDKKEATILAKNAINTDKKKADVYSKTVDDEVENTKNSYFIGNKLSYAKAKERLEALRIGLYFYDKNQNVYQIIRDKDQQVEELTNQKIKELFINGDDEVSPISFLDNGTIPDIEKLYRNYGFFTDSIYEFLQVKKPVFLRDTKNKCFLPFYNGIVEIDREGVKIRKYGEFQNQSIWKSSIIQVPNHDNFEITIHDAGNENVVFYQFIKRICGIEDTLENESKENINRLRSVISIIGYLIHSYKSPDKSFAIILAEETDDELKGGGTGKGIFVKAIEKLINVVTIDGKNFKSDKSFAYQRVRLDTKMVAIQDVARNFDFEKFYSIITEGWTVEKKNKDELFISYEDSPKVLLTTNYSINDSGIHAKRRQKIIEFSSFFGINRTPFDVFGHIFFDDWSEDEWNRFFNFMFMCVNFYLKNGIIDTEQGEKYRLKKVKNQFGEDFLQWWEDNRNLELKTALKFNSLYTEFLEVYSLEKKDYSIKRFKKALKDTATMFGYQLVEYKNRQENNLLYVHIKEN